MSRWVFYVSFPRLSVSWGRTRTRSWTCHPSAHLGSGSEDALGPLPRLHSPAALTLNTHCLLLLVQPPQVVSTTGATLGSHSGLFPELLSASEGLNGAGPFWWASHRELNRERTEPRPA